MSYIVNYTHWKKLFEQQVAQATSTNPVESAMIAWWEAAAKKGDTTAKKSLDYWNGGTGDDTIKKVTDTVINNLTILSTANTKFNKDIIKKVLDYVTKQKLAGIYLLNRFAPGSALSAFANSKIEIVSWANTNSAANNAISTFNSAAPTINTITAELDKNKKIITAITPSDKTIMVEKIRNLAEIHGKQKKLTVEESINKAARLYLRPAEGTSSVNTIKGKSGDAINYEFSYPDKSKPESTEMQNLFADNISVPTPEQVQKFTDLVKTAIDEVAKSGAKIIGINYFAGGRTSKVGTKYLGEGKTDTSWKSENNLILVQDRIAQLNKVLLEELTTNSPKGTVITKIEDESAPNSGPGWYEYSTKNSAGSSVYTYGPLYEAARKTNKSLIPKDFYSKRTSDSAIDTEYNEVFGKFRGSYGAFTLNTEAAETIPGEDIEISASGKWNISIGWKYREPIKFNFRIGANGGGGKAYGGGIAPTKCWIA
jgi:hypothetical protein